MIRPASNVLTKKGRDDKNRNQTTGVADNREDERCAEDQDFFPEPILRQVAVDGGQHCNRHERADAAASLIDLELEVRGVHRRADRVEMHPEKVADCGRRICLEELQTRGRLREEIQRHHEQEERNRERQHEVLHRPGAARFIDL